MMTKRSGMTLLIASCAFFGGAAWSEEVATTFDTEWITLTGEVETVLATSFVLDYGEDDITVELDKFDWNVERSVLPGEKVTVTGRMDRDLFDKRTIEAGTVYVPRLSEFLYADPEDEEGDRSFLRSFAPGMLAGTGEGDWISVSGIVTDVNGDEVTLQSGASKLQVDTALAPVDMTPSDFTTGDRVLVSGQLDAAGLFDDREIEATSVTKLNDRTY